MLPFLGHGVNVRTGPTFGVKVLISFSNKEEMGALNSLWYIQTKSVQRTQIPAVRSKRRKNIGKMGLGVMINHQQWHENVQNDV